jgi:hypothetical protein
MLRSLTSCFRCPFGFSTPLPIPVRPKIGRIHASGPLQLPQPVRQAASICLHFPSGLLPPSGSKRSADPAACQPAFRIRPISVRSPQPRFSREISAADHRSRSATFPEARCSSNLLEPSSLCAGSPFASIAFVHSRAIFLKFFGALFRTGYVESGCGWDVYKTGAGGRVLVALTEI